VGVAVGKRSSSNVNPETPVPVEIYLEKLNKKINGL